MTKKEKVKKIREIFDTIYADARCSLDYSSPLELLVATQLSAQCTDKRVNIVTKELFAKYKTVRDYAAADQAELEAIIRPTGFFRNKAKNIISCARTLIEKYGGEVPGTLEELTSLAGVGRKTANLILGEIFGKSALVIDTHAKRLAKRIGLTENTDPARVEFDLSKIVPPDYQNRFSHQLVRHGREICQSRRPKCGICPISHLCSNFQKAQS